MRLLIVSTLDSKEPFGAFTRPFYLGMYLAKHFEVFQLGIDCSAINYAKSSSIYTRGLRSYIQAIRRCVEDCQPDIIYAQETLPAIAALLCNKVFLRNQPRLVFDFHTLSAFEYWTRLPVSSQKTQELKQLVKTYIAQGTLITSGKPIIAAGKPVLQGIRNWYGINHCSRIHCVSNGVPEDLFNFSGSQDPYHSLRPAKIAVVVAPKTFQFPSNDMSVQMTIDIAKHLKAYKEKIHFVVIGRDAEAPQDILSSNISFTGFLPSRNDFLAHLHYADIGLLPFPREAVAGGARNKSLDYLACQNLVVSTPEGMRGLDDFHHREHLLIPEDSVTAVANTLLEACQNLDSYAPLVKAASRLIREKYSWNAMAEKVAKILKQS